MQPYILARNEGDPLWFRDALTFVKATGESTGGAFGLIEQLVPPGSDTPYHVHHAEDESFYVLEGEITVIVNGQKVKVGPGGFAFGPRNIPHGFRVEGTTPARLLVLATPAGFENFIMEMSVPAKDLTPPPPGPPDIPKMMRLAAKYHIEILGPLPD